MEYSLHKSTPNSTNPYHVIMVTQQLKPTNKTRKAATWPCILNYQLVAISPTCVFSPSTSKLKRIIPQRRITKPRCYMIVQLVREHSLVNNRSTSILHPKRTRPNVIYAIEHLGVGKLIFNTYSVPRCTKYLFQVLLSCSLQKVYNRNIPNPVIQVQPNLQTCDNLLRLLLTRALLMSLFIVKRALSRMLTTAGQ